VRSWARSDFRWRCGGNCGLLAGLGHWLIVSAFQHAQPSLLTAFSYLQMIWATLYGYLIFDQLPDRWSGVGMAIIVASGLLLALQERRRARY
jgi:drug/metabolite transporter (DMT)-like permease